MNHSINQETINDTAKLIMHRLIARQLARDPRLIDRAKMSLERLSARFPSRSFVSDWDDLLRRPIQDLRSALVRRNERMKRLRLSSPFVTAEGVDFSNDDLRRRIRRAAKRLAISQAKAAHHTAMQRAG